MLVPSSESVPQAYQGNTVKSHCLLCVLGSIKEGSFYKGSLCDFAIMFVTFLKLLQSVCQGNLKMHVSASPFTPYLGSVIDFKSC
jgi:hypothetical protein